MKLVIAEKPSVAKTYADVLGATTKKDGYYEGGGYLVSWCVGHLLGLAPPTAYGEKYAKWHIADLPIKPTMWQYIGTDSTKKQLSTLVSLMQRPDVTEVINGADAGREGELIFGLVYEHAQSNKPTKRLWISSMEESAVREGFDQLKDSRNYTNLLHAAKCRQQADWFVGMNLSRLFSISYNAQLNVGRVQSPTLAMVVERSHKVSHFVKDPFYTLELKAFGLTATSKRYPDKSQAEKLAHDCQGKVATVTSVTKEAKNVSPPKLYDLTTLQREANKTFGYTASKTLELTQTLYEQKLLTYPRTDSKFITEDMASGTPTLIDHALANLHMNLHHKPANVTAIVNNSKVADHHAIIPTPSATASAIANLGTDERNLFQMVSAKLLAATAHKHSYDETAVTIDCGDITFTAKGKTILDQGFKEIEANFDKLVGKKTKATTDTTLPPLSEGMTETPTLGVVEGFTSPPKLFTEDTLLSAMENAGSEGVEEDIDCKGLGTPATRASIIENLVKLGYLTRDKKNLVPTPKGINLIKVLPDQVKSPLLTADWENNLKRMERGEVAPDAFMEAVYTAVETTITTHEPLADKNLFPSAGGTGEVLGSCPKCKKDMRETPKAFSCACGFAIFKADKFFASQGSQVTKTLVKALLAKGQAPVTNFVSSKTGKGYSCTVVLSTTDTNYPKWDMVFPKGKKK